MKILITGTTYPPAYNGQAVFTANLTEGLAKRGHEVWMVIPTDRGKPYREDRNGVHIESVRATEVNFLHTQTYITLLPDVEVLQIFKRFEPDIVHLHDHYPLSKCILWHSRKRHLPVVGTNHFVPENLAPYVPLLPKIGKTFNGLLWWWMKRVYNQLDMVTAPSKTAVSILKAQNLRPTVYPISCGVDIDRFRPQPDVDRRAVRRKFGLDETKTTFLFVGRVDAEKHVDKIILAVKLLDRGDIQFAVTGIGADLNHLKDLTRQLGLEDRVIFTGFAPVEDLPRLLNSVDVFVMPSEAELLSIASLEAMSTGRPLLVARSKALPELVAEGVNGYTFEPGNVKDAARCMALLADHPERWVKMGAVSLKMVQKHSLENVILRYESLYKTCIKRSLAGVPAESSQPKRSYPTY